MQKITLFYLLILEIQSISENSETRLVKPIFGHPNQKKILINFSFFNLYQHAKIEAVSLICYGEIVDL